MNKAPVLTLVLSLSFLPMNSVAMTVGEYIQLSDLEPKMATAWLSSAVGAGVSSYNLNESCKAELSAGTVRKIMADVFFAVKRIEDSEPSPLSQIPMSMISNLMVIEYCFGNFDNFVDHQRSSFESFENFWESLEDFP